jgi:hypothetical protein
MSRKHTIKLADDATFEQNFFQLAFSYVRDKIPNLLDYMLGFEVVNKNDEGTQAIGLFKFDIGGRELYIPVFYKNGELKGADLLYNKNQDSFVPNKENWVDTVLNSRPEELGLPSEMSRMDIMTGANSGFDLSKIYNTTQNTKLSFSKMASISTKHSVSFLDFLKQADCSVSEKYARTLMIHSRLHKLASDAYGSALYEALSGCKKAENIVLDNNKVPDVEVVVSTSDDTVLQDLSDSERTSLIEDGFVVRDNRSDGRIPYKIEKPMILGATMGPGVYDVMMRGGGFAKAVAVPTMTPSDSGENYIFIPLDDKNNSCQVKSTDLFVASNADNDVAFENFVSKLPGATSAKSCSATAKYDSPAPHCIFMEADGRQAMGPFCLETPVEADNTKTYSVKCGKPYCIRTVVVSKAYRKMHMSEDTLYVPEASKVFCYSAKQYGCAAPNLGTARDIDAKIKGLFDEVKVAKDARGYKISSNGRLIGYDATYDKAVLRMVKDLHIKASEAVKAVRGSHGLDPVVLKFEKRAQPFDPGMVFNPQVPPVPMGMNPVLGVPEQYPQANTMNAMQGMPGDIQDQNIMNSLTGMGNSGPTLPQPSVDAIMQAAQSGDREVFDIANISELINKSDIDTPLDKYMSDLQLALDRLGRIYFLMLFHGDKFAERFSQEDLPAMEESIRNVFLNLGEVILKLKERKIEADSGSAVETDLNQLL